MQKAAEDLKKQQEKEAAEKRRIIEERVPKLNIDGMGEGNLTGLQINLACPGAGVTQMCVKIYRSVSCFYLNTLDCACLKYIVV